MKKVVSTIVICMIMICNLTGCTTDKINSSSNKTTIYFVRHGQTDTNVEGLMVGQSGDPQLTEDGKNNAFKLGKCASCLMTVVDSTFKNTHASSEERERGLSKMIELALDSVLYGI